MESEHIWNIPLSRLNTERRAPLLLRGDRVSMFHFPQVPQGSIFERIASVSASRLTAFRRCMITLNKNMNVEQDIPTSTGEGLSVELGSKDSKAEIQSMTRQW